jgi:hypothetical protein
LKEADTALRIGLQEVAVREKAMKESYDASHGRIQLLDFRILRVDEG